MIFQEPMASLLPLRTIGAQLIETIRIHTGLGKKTAREKAVDLLGQVGIPKPHERVDAYPFQLSGGMCQRVMIAIALCANPSPPDRRRADDRARRDDAGAHPRPHPAPSKASTRWRSCSSPTTSAWSPRLADEVAVMYLGRVVERARR